jgi:hypothetical protein
MARPPQSPGTSPPKPPRRRPPLPPNPEDNSGGSGRPSKFGPDLALRICGLVGVGNYRHEAAKACGVHPVTLQRWLALGLKYPTGDYAAFRSLLMEAEKTWQTSAVQALDEAGRYGDPKNLRWLLERREPKLWGRNRLEVVRVRQELRKSERLREKAEAEIESLREKLRNFDVA